MLSKFCVSMMQIVVGTTKFSGARDMMYMHTVDMYTMSQKSVPSLTGYSFNTHLKWVEMAEMMLFLRHCYSVMGASSTSVVRYPRYLDTYRRYLRDDTSIARSRYTAVYRSSTKYRETAQVSRVSTIACSSYHLATCTLQACDAE